MKIAILVRRLYPPGGAEESMVYLGNMLRNNHTVKMFGYNSKDGNVPDFAYSKPMPKPSPYLPRLLNESKLAIGNHRKVLEFSPDIIFAQHEPALFAGILREVTDTSVVVFLRDERHIINPEDGSYSLIEQYTKKIPRVLDKRWNKWVLKNADEVISNSRYTSNIYKEEYSVDSFVVHPFVDENRYSVSQTGDAILHVNPSLDKGIDITLEVAQSLPDETFIIVGTSPEEEMLNEINALKNVDYLGYVDDMRDVYTKVKLVLFPARWQEPFGRVPVEAGLNGIPTITSGKGGLKESVPSNDLIVQSNEPEEYVSKTNYILNNYEQFSHTVRKHAQDINGESQYNRLIQRLSDVLPEKHNIY